MNRRTFLKRVGGAIAGIAGFCLLPKKEKLGWRLAGMKTVILDDDKTCSIIIDKVFYCKICRNTGKVWSSDIKEDPYMMTTPQQILAVRSCDCHFGIAREKELQGNKTTWNPYYDGKRKRLGLANTHPLTEGEIGPIEGQFSRVWTENGRRTIVRERKTSDGKIITDKSTLLPEPAKMLHIYFGRVVAICENATCGEKQSIFKN